MKLFINTLLTLFILTGLAGNVYADSVVAVVNGKKIMQSELDMYIKYVEAATRQKITNQMAVLNELVNRELLYQQAVKKKLDKNNDLNYLLKQQKYDLYINHVLRDTEVGKPIPEAEVKKLYDEKVKNLNLLEYKVRHILLKNSENDAKTVIAELDKGKDFVAVAKEKSEGPSAANGGDIGWVNAAQLSAMPEFAQAISEMKKGSYSKSPVKTQYGWHVIKLEDARQVDPPALEKVEKQISSSIRQQRLRQYVSDLRDKSKIDIKLKN